MSNWGVGGQNQKIKEKKTTDNVDLSNYYTQVELDGLLGDKQNKIVAAKTFYVNGFNTVDGDGSIINPFKTIDLAYNTIVGDGTALNPDITNVTIEVAGYSGTNYATTKNLIINSVQWDFKNGAEVVYNGYDYLFRVDSSVTTQLVNYINGDGAFINNSGGLIFVSQDSITGLKLWINCKSLYSKSTDTSKIMCTSSGLNGYSRGLQITFKEYIYSDHQTIFKTTVNGSINVLGNSSGYSTINLINPTQNRNVRVLDIDSQHVSTFRSFRVVGRAIDYYFDIKGDSRALEFVDINILSSSNSSHTPAKAFIRFGSTFRVSPNRGGAASTIYVIIKDVYQTSSRFDLTRSSTDSDGNVGYLIYHAVDYTPYTHDLYSIFIDGCTFISPIDPRIAISQKVNFDASNSLAPINNDNTLNTTFGEDITTSNIILGKQQFSNLDGTGNLLGLDANGNLIKSGGGSSAYVPVTNEAELIAALESVGDKNILIMNQLTIANLAISSIVNIKKVVGFDLIITNSLVITGGGTIEFLNDVTINGSSTIGATCMVYYTRLSGTFSLTNQGVVKYEYFDGTFSSILVNQPIKEFWDSTNLLKIDDGAINTFHTWSSFKISDEMKTNYSTEYTASFTVPINSNNKEYTYNSVADGIATVQTDICGIGEYVLFRLTNSGALSFTNGSGVDPIVTTSLFDKLEVLNDECMIKRLPDNVGNQVYKLI